MPTLDCGWLVLFSKTPVCVLGLGLIGGSVMRAAAAVGREVFGYNRSVESAQGAVADGFDATTELTDTLTRAADTDALIVLAVPMPAVPGMLAHISELAPGCPLTDVTSVKCAVLEAVTAAGLQERFVGGHPMTGTENSGWTAGHAGLFTMAPWVVSVDDHVDPVVFSMVMTLALDCGSVVVPAKSDEHDAAAATISHLPHLFAEALAVAAGEVPLAFALAAGSFRDATRVAGSPPDLVRAMCEGNSGQLAAGGGPGYRAAEPCPRLARLPRLGGRARRGGPRGADALRQLPALRRLRRRCRRGELARGAGRRGARRRSDQIRSANPG